MSDNEKLTAVEITPLESGFVVQRDSNYSSHRTAEPTLQGALTLAARALGYRGVIRFDDEPQTSGTVNAPYIPRANERLAEVPVVNAVVAAALGVPFDDEEPNLRAGTAKPGDKL